MPKDKNVTPWDLCIKHIILFLFFMMITRLAIQSALQIAKGKNIFLPKNMMHQSMIPGKQGRPRARSTLIDLKK